MSRIVEPSKIDLVFECEDCENVEKDSVANVTYNGPPICCSVEMMLAHAEVQDIN